MKKTILYSFSVLFTYAISYAQVVEPENNLKKKITTDTTGKWDIGGSFTTTFSQTSLTNWQAGGQNSTALNSLFNIHANKKMNTIAWENLLIFSYGIIKQGKDNAIPFTKSDDKIDFTSKIGKEINEKLYYAGLLNFRSQFTNGKENATDSTIISRFLAPGYILAAIGIDYKPNKEFSAFVAPFTSKTTLVFAQELADNGAYGVLGIGKTDRNGDTLTVGKNTRSEVGGYVRISYNKEILKNVKLTTNADFFSNYLENFGNIDVNWQVILAMKVNKNITCNLNTHLIYDDDIDIAIDTNNDGIIDKRGPRIQFKQIFGAGLAYNFSNKPKK